MYAQIQLNSRIPVRASNVYYNPLIRHKVTSTELEYLPNRKLTDDSINTALYNALVELECQCGTRICPNINVLTITMKQFCSKRKQISNVVCVGIGL